MGSRAAGCFSIAGRPTSCHVASTARRILYGLGMSQLGDLETPMLVSCCAGMLPAAWAGISPDGGALLLVHTQVFGGLRTTVGDFMSL